MKSGTSEVLAVGADAKRMLGRTPGNIVAIRPLKDGVIADFEITEALLQMYAGNNRNIQYLVDVFRKAGSIMEPLEQEEAATKTPWGNFPETSDALRSKVAISQTSLYNIQLIFQ